jgi:hypothetical protein
MEGKAWGSETRKGLGSGLCENHTKPLEFPVLPECIDVAIYDDPLQAHYGPYLDIPHCLSGIVGHDDVGSYPLAVVVRLFIEGDLEVQFALRKREALADERAGQTVTATRGCILQLKPFIGQFSFSYSSFSCLSLPYTGLCPRNATL